METQPHRAFNKQNSGQESREAPREKFKQEVLEHLERVRIEREAVEKNFGSLAALAQLSPEQQEAYVESVYRLHTEAVQARERFWNKIRTMSAVLFFAFAGAHKDAATDYGKGSFMERDLASQELAEKGITQYQRSAYIPGLNDALARGFHPFGYSNLMGSDIARGIGSVLVGSFTDLNASRLRDLHGYSNKTEMDSAGQDSPQGLAARLDAWYLYLGLPQSHQTFGISQFKPSLSKEDHYYYKLNNFENRLIEWGRHWSKFAEYQDMKPLQVILNFIEHGYVQKNEPGSTKRLFSDDLVSVMGQYTLSKGEDERGHYISYYDKWNLEGSIEGTEGLIGKPYEIYDRIYYNPQTFEVIKDNKK